MNLSLIFISKREKQRGDKWADEIREDVFEECAKYGGIVHISVDTVAPNGCIYIKCESIATASSAVAGLNGRYFAGM
jgi:RNA-binding protein 39